MVKKTVYSNGRTTYRDNSGCLHREDGPAEIAPSVGLKAWYRNGMLHREDGPAVVFDHRPENSLWYLYGKRYTFEEWCEKNTSITYEEKIEIALRFL